MRALAPIASPADDTVPACERQEALGDVSTDQVVTRIERRVHYLVGLLCLAAMATFLVVAMVRLTYPYELEWLEGVMVDGVRWLLAGHSLYSAPSVQFVPAVYNPVYYWICALLTRLLGDGFVPLRLVSIAATTGTFVLLWLYLARGSRTAGLVAAGLYAASYRVAGAWMDTGKSDALFLFLLLAAFLLGRDARSVGRHVLAACGYALAIYTKQTAFPIVLLALMGQMLVYTPRLWVQWLSLVVLLAATFEGLNTSTSGWYAFYTVHNLRDFVPSEDQGYFFRVLRADLLPGVLLASAYVSTVVWRRWRAVPAKMQRQSEARSGGWAARVRLARYFVHHDEVVAAAWRNSLFALALVASSWAVFRQRGTYDNSFLPACLGLAMIAGLAYQEVWRRAATSVLVAGRRIRGSFLFGAVASLVVAQFALLVYNPIDQLPKAADRAAGDRMVASIRSLPGEVLVWDHGYYGAMAGKTTYLHGFIYADAAGWYSRSARTRRTDRRRAQVAQTLTDALQQQAFDWVVVDALSNLWAPYYLPVGEVFDAPGVFYPVTGRRTRPEVIMRKNPIARGGRLPLTDVTLEPLFTSGWSAPTAWGRWALGNAASVTVNMEAGVDYVVGLDLLSRCEGAAAKQTVVVRWNGALLDRRTVETCGSARISSALAADLIRAGDNVLQLEFERPASTDVAASGDQPEIATGITGIRFDQDSQ